MRSLPGYKLSWSVSGLPPISTMLIKNFTVLANATTTDGNFDTEINGEGNYSLVATNKHGTDVKEFSVILNGKILFREGGL